MLFRVRIDETVPDMGEKLKQFVQGKEHVLVKHTLPNNKNPHFHFFLQDTSVISIQSFRYKLDKYTNAKGSDRSLKICDEERKDEYIQYLFNSKHGNVFTLLSTTIPVEEYIERARKVAYDFMETKTKNKKSSEITTWELAEHVREYLYNDKTEPVSEYDIYSIAIDHAIEVHRKYKKTYTDFSILRVVQTAITSDKNYREKFKENIINKIFKN